MIDRPRNPLDQQKRQSAIERVVRDPLKYLRSYREQGNNCRACIIFLRKVSREIQDDSSYAIRNPDPTYAQFQRNSNGTVEHYIALFTLLKETGFSRVDVESALMDDLPVPKKDQDIQFSSPREIVRYYLKLTKSALDEVY